MKKTNTALMSSFILSNDSALGKLLEVGANVDIKNNKGDTALIRVANDLEHVNIAKKLVKDTSDVLIKNNKDANVINIRGVF